MARVTVTRWPLDPCSERGVSLLEALVAMAVLLVITGSVAGLLLSSRRAVWAAGIRTQATTLAADKMERLLSLPWSIAASGLVISDDSTDLSSDPADDGGSGLTGSPGGTLTRDVEGFADYVDAYGRALGGGARPPPGAAFVRRWSIEPLMVDPADSRVLTVVVLPVFNAARGEPAGPRAVRIATIRTRTAE